MFLYFKKRKKTRSRIMLLIQDKEKALIKRSLKAESDTYDGAQIEIDLHPPLNKKYFLSIKQTIHLEMETGINCKNYPFGGFASYRDCDEDFVYNEMKMKYGVMPFWAAKSLDEVTNLT